MTIRRRLPSLHRPLAAVLALAVLGAAEPAEGGRVFTVAPADRLADPADRIPWPEAAYPRFAAGSAVDAGAWLGDGKPAGSRGAVATGPDGRLRFADGTPARFWGTTLCYGATFPDKPEEIDQLADVIAAQGYNLVRCHHNDTPWGGVGFMKDGSAIELDPQQIDRFDRLMAALIRRGVYLYVDLVDSRGWTAETGMEDWQELKKLADGGNQGWKGVWPMPPMVAAWKKAGTALLTHVNPHTGRSLAAEPAVACVEILNENGVFWDWGFKTTPRVKQWFDGEWNRWLLARYGSRAGLAKAWTDAAGAAGLGEDEDPAAGSVYRPQMIALTEWERSNRSKARGACRFNDHYAFLAELATGFYREAAAHLRSLGYQGPLVGSHELRGPINQQAEALGTGTVSAHLYANSRLAWGARPGVKGVTVTGVDVRSNNWFVNIPRVKVAGCSSWNNEWAAGSLSYRADANLAIAAMSAFHRLDGSVHFGLQGRWSGVPMPAHDTLYDWRAYRKAFEITFSSLHDAPWMAVNRVAAAMFRRGDVPAGRYRVHLAHSAEDVGEQNLHALGLDGGAGTVGGAALFLPLLHEVETAFFDQAYAGGAEVVVSTGRSASGDYRQARHALVLGDNPWCDRHHQKRDLAAPARLLHPGLQVATLDQPTVYTLAFGAGAPRQVTLPRTEAALAVASLPAGALAIGTSADGKWALGWCDRRFLVLPAAGELDRAGGDARWLYRLYLGALAHWGLELSGNSADSTVYRSDNGALVTDWGTGTQCIDTPRTQAVAGFAGLRSVNRTANLELTVTAPYAAVALTSVDGAPIASARRLLLVATARGANTGTEYTTGADGQVRLTKTGSAPIVIEGLRGTIRLHGLADNGLEVHALDHEGRRLGQLPVARTDGALAFALSPRWRSHWFEVCAPGTAGPAAPEPARSAWPGDEAARSEAVAAPSAIPVGEYLALLARPAAPAAAPAAALGDARLPLTDPAAWKPFQAYGNLTMATTKVGEVPVLELAVGRHNPKDWHAGAWFNLAPAGGLKAADVTALTVRFQGDGTLPRELTIEVEARGEAGPVKARSRNLNRWCEDTAWREERLAATDFTPAVDLSRLTKLSVTVVGPLMESRHLLRLGAFQLATAGVTEVTVPSLDGRLPAIVPLAKPVLALPWVADAAITADGDPAEPAWARAVGVAMDEDAVPAWQQVGSFVADGNRRKGEKARFWLLATPAGLALVADVDKGGEAPVNLQKDWWRGDCVELFSDAGLARGKPTRQLFLAYRRPGLDRPAASAPATQVGRVRTARGYALEALIPWADLGLDGRPGASFGLDLQLDIGDSDGRRLMLCLGTGTNEAWMSAARYLSVTIQVQNP